MTKLQKLLAQHRQSKKRWLKMTDLGVKTDIKLVSKEFDKMHKLRSKIQKIYNNK